jgi:hypothetical protein
MFQSSTKNNLQLEILYARLFNLSLALVNEIISDGCFKVSFYA